MEPKNIATNLPIAAWNIIMNALGQRPYAEVAEVIDLVRGQAQSQIDQPLEGAQPDEPAPAKSA
jgi:hypothetical protein